MSIDPALFTDQVSQSAIIFYPPELFMQFLTVFGVIVLLVGIGLGVWIDRKLHPITWEDEEPEGEE